ncbi:MAG: hypothetical protein J6A22_07180 [Bacteroidales bacterium]|nr:hypothetical protein [Bacteroidales bacterium]
MEYRKHERTTPQCLECGEKIRYGRTDKKFCCEDCRSRHYNRLARSGRAYRRRVLAQLSRNYAILEELVRAGKESVDLSDIEVLGFSPNVVTSFSRGRKYVEYACFDIRYVMTESRIYSITKKSLTL